MGRLYAKTDLDKLYETDNYDDAVFLYICDSSDQIEFECPMQCGANYKQANSAQSVEYIWWLGASFK